MLNRMTADDRRWREGLLVIAVVALLLRAGLVLLSSHYGQLFGDPADYETHAAFIATGHGYPPTTFATPGTPSAFRPPAYPYLLGATYAVFGIHPVVGGLLGAALGVLTVVLIACLGARLWSRRVGLAAGALAAVWPSLIALNSTLLSESLFLPLELGVGLGVLALRRKPTSAAWAIGTGALCGVAALTRTVGILWLVPAVLTAASGATAWPRRGRSAAAVLLACGTVLAPWAIRNANAFHAFVPLNTQGGFTLAGQYNAVSGRDDAFQAIPRVPSQVPGLVRDLEPLYRRPGGANEAQLDSRLTRDALRYIGRHPSHVAIASALDALRMFDVGQGHQFTTSLAYREMNLSTRLRGLTTVTIQLLALFVLGGVAGRAAGRIGVRFGSPLLWAVPLPALLATVPVVGTVRYRAPADPFLILLAAAIASALVGKQRNRRPRVAADEDAAGDRG